MRDYVEIKMRFRLLMRKLPGNGGIRNSDVDVAYLVVSRRLRLNSLDAEVLS